MPVVIVDALELVDVAHHQRDRLVQSHRVLPHVVQTILEGAPVLDLSEPVGEGNFPQFVVKVRQLLLACRQCVL